MSLSENSIQPDKAGSKIPCRYDYDKVMSWLLTAGQKIFGEKFRIVPEDYLTHIRLLSYFLKDDLAAAALGLDLSKGVLLTGPVGCGKSSLMELMRKLSKPHASFNIRPCREVSFEFSKDGYEVVYRYSHKSFYKHTPIAWCFDDLGTENNLKFYGNEKCNVMAEILTSRYDLFVSTGLITHLTTNLSASEIEEAYGNRVRSRMRQMFNLIAFDKSSIDKRN